MLRDEQTAFLTADASALVRVSDVAPHVVMRIRTASTAKDDGENALSITGRGDPGEGQPNSVRGWVTGAVLVIGSVTATVDIGVDGEA